MRKAFLFLFLLPSFSKANNLTGFWYTDGGYKVSQNQFYPPSPGNSLPTCSTCVISRVWDGTNINQFSAQGETVGGALYLLNGGGADATNVMVSASSMSCQGGGSIVSVAVSSTNVWNTTTRPTQLFLAKYVPIYGLSSLPYGKSEYNEKIWPPRFRDPGYPTTMLWANRPDNNAPYPIGLVPMEEYAVSSFTVTQSSSQAIWIDTWVSTSILAGNCTGQLTVTEGVSVSTTIPYYIKVYPFQMPTSYTIPTIVDVGNSDTDKRLNGGSVDLVGRQHINQLLRAHGFGSTMGDSPDINTNEFPSSEYQSYLNGSIYTSVNGYGNARMYGIGQPIYIIGTYQSWASNPNFSATDANLFCTAVSSWSTNLASYSGLRAALYLADEASSTTLVTSNEKWATWLSTSCTMGGAYVNSWVTNALPTTQKYAPHTTMAVAASVFGYDPNHPYPNENGYAYTPSTWQIAYNQFLTTGNVQGWRYNDNAFGSGAFPKPEEEGYIPRANFWGTWLKLCAPSPSPGVCKGGHFEWESNYWTDSNNGRNNNDLWNDPKTFGYFTSTSTQWGRDGFNYTQEDGVLVWPGNDTVFPSESFGFQGAIATWPLKMYRRGVDDADVMGLAAQFNLTFTTTVVRNLISKALWEVPCSAPGSATQLADCSYNNTTDRTWSYDPNAYTTGIESLYQVLSSSTPYITSAKSVTAQQSFTFTYQVTASSMPTSFSASSLPPGLSINTTTGLVSGTPTTVGITNAVITATNGNGIGSPATVVFTILPFYPYTESISGTVNFSGVIQMQ